MKRIRKIVWKILNFLNIGGYLQVFLKGNYLYDMGWIKSYNSFESTDANNNPIPWCSYPFIDFISERITKNMKIFEYGSGNSTIFYASKCYSIKAIDHDKSWVDKINNKLPKNATVLYKELIYDGNYCREINQDNTKYNVVIIDGRDRNNCVYNCIPNLAEDGVILFDNTQMNSYNESISFLKEKGFRKIDFWGISPIASHKNCTTIFYKSNNCLTI